ncbi:MAG TPA: hypothetical protein DIT05_09050 [Morganella sp. (in: Bacteria)]|nr:hypothetical protein [Morganella sp. (in: enterobacteria)]
MNNITYDNQVIVIFTAGWRYLAGLSCLAFIFQFMLYISGFSGEYQMAAGIVFFLCAHYFIFRLWLDHHLFRHLAKTEENSAFDDTLTTLFPGRAQHTSYAQRLTGTKRLFQQGALCMVIQWGVAVITLMN